MKNAFTIEIDAPPARVFHWLDGGERVLRWIPNLVENADLDVKPGKVGSTFRHVYLERGRHMEMTGTVTAYERNRRLACALDGALFDLVVDYRLDDLGGRTRLTQESETHFKSAAMKLMGLLMKPFMRKMTQAQVDQTFAALKRLAESNEA
jgi:uncharacterized protein YndB with AHSA1/START domain